MRLINKLVLYFIALFLAPAFAHAHIINANGFGSGFFHPLSGLDHLLAMAAVGAISIQLGKKATWVVPLAFIVMMVFGGVAGIFGAFFIGAEYAIAFSVIVLGIGMAFANKIPRKYSTALVLICAALSGFFHGHAHGEEMPIAASPVLYALGFVFATAILHISGAAIGHYASKTGLRLRLLRSAGMIMSLIGAYLMFGF